MANPIVDYLELGCWLQALCNYCILTRRPWPGLRTRSMHVTHNRFDGFQWEANGLWDPPSAQRNTKRMTMTRCSNLVESSLHWASLVQSSPNVDQWSLQSIPKVVHWFPTEFHMNAIDFQMVFQRIQSMSVRILFISIGLQYWNVSISVQFCQLHDC